MHVPAKAWISWAGSLAMGAGLGTLGTEPDVAEVVFLSVGQGDCTVIRDGEQTILIDAGPATDQFDAGARLVATKLRRMGVDRVDLVLLTHPDADHIGGLSGLASHIRIDRIAAAGYFRGHQEIGRELREANWDSERVLWLWRDSLLATLRAMITIRLPNDTAITADNEGSPFIKVRIGADSVVLTGDAGEEAEAAELGRDDWSATILQAGHHGSAGSTSSPWLREVQPRFVVVSCGRNNRYGHPAPATLERIAEAGADVLRTDQAGDIRFILKGDRLAREP